MLAFKEITRNAVYNIQIQRILVHLITNYMLLFFVPVFYVIFALVEIYGIKYLKSKNFYIVPTSMVCSGMAYWV